MYDDAPVSADTKRTKSKRLRRADSPASLYFTSSDIVTVLPDWQYKAVAADGVG